MKKQVKKLTLRRETVVALESYLEQVQGGSNNNTVYYPKKSDSCAEKCLILT